MTKLEELPPSEITEELRKRVAQLNAVIDLKLKALKHAPEGSLNISECRGNPQYYHRTRADSTKGRYIASGNLTLARRLAQKDYDARVLKALKKETRILQTALTQLEAESSQTSAVIKIFQNLIPHRRALVIPVTLTDTQYAAAWLSQKYEGKPFAPDAPEYYTARGERVRSKSEVIIADTLSRLGVPYRYEYPLSLKGGGRATTAGSRVPTASSRIQTFCPHSSVTVYPDFFCLNLRTRREFIWEHFGLMNDADYAAKTVQKLNTYNENGIFPGHNLIITAETSSRPLNTRQIENLIHTFLK